MFFLSYKNKKSLKSNSIGIVSEPMKRTGNKSCADGQTKKHKKKISPPIF